MPGCGPASRTWPLAKARVAATTAVNKAVLEGQAKSIRYQDLIAIKNDQQGRPVLLQPNTGELNRLAAQITLDVQHALLDLKRTWVRTPGGAGSRDADPRVMGSGDPGKPAPGGHGGGTHHRFIQRCRHQPDAPPDLRARNDRGQSGGAPCRGHGTHPDGCSPGGSGHHGGGSGGLHEWDPAD